MKSRTSGPAFFVKKNQLINILKSIYIINYQGEKKWQ